MTPREYLFHLERFGIKLGLDNIRCLLDGAGRPQEAFPAVHVAGTNGKGSVLAFLDAIARAAGYRVGRFTSPHLIDVTERFLIDGTPIANDELDVQIEYFRGIAETMPSPPTFFELTTAVAFRWFAQSGVDLALIETGMGGRLDSTNVLQPCATAITNIALDHTQFLGDTLAKIAFEKAGILKPNVPAVLGQISPEAAGVILARAADLGAPVSRLGHAFRFGLEGEPFDLAFQYQSDRLTVEARPLGLAGKHQGENASVASALAESLTPAFPRLTTRAIASGLEAVRWPCRLERVLETPPVILDVAHNPDGARQVAKAVPCCVALLAVSADKDAAGMIEALKPITTTFVATQYTGARALPAAQLGAMLGDTPHVCIPFLEEAIEHGLGLAGTACPLLITGSIFTAGEARRILTEHYGAAPLAF